VVGGEEHLHGDAREAVRPRLVSLQAAAEAAAAELGDLGLVLAADVGVAKDEHVVQVAVRVGDGEVGRARKERRGWQGPAAAVVAQDELLVEEGRVVVAAHLDVGAKERRQDAPVLGQVGLVLEPPGAKERSGGGFAFHRLRRIGRPQLLPESTAQVVLFQEHLEASSCSV
jgi:hypothetical protein